MFFTTTPNALRHPQPCSLENGTTVYYDGSNKNLDCSCLAPIKADPDFAGPGIIASFVFICWLTIIIAAIPTGYALFNSWGRTTGSFRFFRWILANLQFEPIEDSRRKSTSLSRPPLRHSNAKDIGDSGSDSSTDRLPMARQPSAMRIKTVREPIICKWSRRIVLQLCDIQIITGIAVLVSALAQYNNLTFYHAQFATQFWWLTLNSFWISRIDYSRNTPEMNTWRACVRRLSLWLSVALSIAMQSIVAYREYKMWNITVPGHCYVSSGTGTGFGQNIFWLAGTGLYFLVLTVGLTPASRKWFDENVNAKIIPSIYAMHAWVTESRNDTEQYINEHKESSRLQYIVGVTLRHIRTLCYVLAWVTWWLVILFLSVWCAGNSAALFELGLYSVFAGFLTWWIVFLKVQNQPLIRGDESRFTMGQTLPLFLLLLMGIHALDVWAGVVHEERKRLQNHDVPTVHVAEDEEEDVATNAAVTGMWTSRPFEPVTPQPSATARFPDVRDVEKQEGFG
jgi:hypothetical protein